MEVKKLKKSLFASKGVWGGLLLIAGGILTAAGKFLSGDMDFTVLVTTVVPLIGNGLGILGIRVAMP